MSKSYNSSLFPTLDNGMLKFLAVILALVILCFKDIGETVRQRETSTHMLPSAGSLPDMFAEFPVGLGTQHVSPALVAGTD